MTLNPQIPRQMMMVGWGWAAEFLPHLFGALAILVVGLTIASWIARGTRNIVQRTPHLDPALKPIIVAVVRYSVVGFIIVITLDQIGFHTSSLLAVIGAAGLAIGLALQGTLSNIAAGIMLLWLRPFQVMDYIEVAGQGGSVEEIGLFGCKLRTFDGLFLFLPNSTIWNAPLKNHTRNHGRLISLDISLPVAADLAKVREALVQAAGGTKEVLTQPPPKVFLEESHRGRCSGQPDALVDAARRGRCRTSANRARPRCAGKAGRQFQGDPDHPDHSGRYRPFALPGRARTDSLLEDLIGLVAQSDAVIGCAGEEVNAAIAGRSIATRSGLPGGIGILIAFVMAFIERDHEGAPRARRLAARIISVRNLYGIIRLRRGLRSASRHDQRHSQAKDDPAHLAILIPADEGGLKKALKFGLRWVFAGDQLVG